MKIWNFEDYITHTHTDFYISKRDHLRIREGMESYTVADTYIFICSIDVDSFETQYTNLLIGYCSPDNTIREHFIVSRYNNGRLKFGATALDNILEEINVTDQSYAPQLKRLYRNYFTKIINLSLKINPALTAKCGWLFEGQDAEYIPLSASAICREKIESDFFNGLLQDDKLQKNAEYLLREPEQLRDFFEFIQSGEVLLAAFSYSIHSVLWNYLYRYEPNPDFYPEVENSIFALCLHGKDARTSKIIANVLLNFFVIQKNDWHIIKNKYHISASSKSSANNLENLAAYKSVPIIITRRNNKFNFSSSVIKKVQQSREKNEFSIFPVYISTTPVKADEIHNACTDFLSDNTNFNDPDFLRTMHLKFCILLYEFIGYLSEISNPERQPSRMTDQYMRSRVKNVRKEKNLDAEWLEEHYPEYLLYASMDSYCECLKDTTLQSYAERLRTTCERFFLKPDYVYVPQVKSEPVDYMKHLHTFIHKSLRQKGNEEWIYEGIDRRDNNTAYYYLHEKTGFPKFTDYLEQKNIPIIKKHHFNRLLRQEKIIRPPASKKSNTWYRRKRYYYLIYKDSFDQRYYPQ